MFSQNRTAACAAVLGAMLSSAEPAAAWLPGFPPLPSTCAQWWGYGYGPGQHAPMLLTPGAEPDRGPRTIRTRGECALMPPAPYAPIGCYHHGCHCGTSGSDAGYLPGASPIIYPHPHPAMAPAPASAQRDDSLTWR